MNTSQFLNVDEAAAFLGMKATYLRKLCFLREIPFYKPRGRLLFDKAELEARIRAGRVPSNEELAEKADALLNHGRKAGRVRA